MSAQQMIDTKDDFRKWGDYLITREFDDIQIDGGICDDIEKLCWLHFSDCVNNGGTCYETSKIFRAKILSEGGKVCQI